MSTFLLLYGLLNAYFLLRARAALHFGPGISIVLVLFLLTMITAPILVRLSENAGFAVLARIIYVVGFSWLGLLFLFVCVAILIDAGRAAFYLLGYASGIDFSFLTAYGKAYFLISVAVVGTIGLYGFFEARTIRSERIMLGTSKLAAGSEPLRIVQISDVHLGLGLREGRLRLIMDLVKQAKPDLLVSTGDLVDGLMYEPNGMSELLDSLRPRYGKFAITGNHEFYAGIEQALAFTRKSGFRVLRGEITTIPDVITIVGVDDPAGPGIGSSAKGEKELLTSAPRDLFVLFLKHRPDVARESRELFDLQLSGHVHYGQIFPFRLITRIFYPLIGGLYAISSNSYIYVSRGTGTWGPPIRFLAPPEVTIIDLISRAHE